MLNIKKRLQVLPNSREAFELLKALEQCYNTQCLGSAGLAINAATTPTWKMTNASALPFIINGVLATKAAATAQAIPAAAALSATGQNAVMVTVGLDITGALNLFTSPVSTAPNAVAALAGIIPAQVSDGIAVIGQIIIQSNATAFTPGTTNLDAAGITVTYVNTTGPFFPISPI